jgi:hypothetical protein
MIIANMTLKLEKYFNDENEGLENYKTLSFGLIFDSDPIETRI